MLRRPASFSRVASLAAAAITALLLLPGGAFAQFTDIGAGLPGVSNGSVAWGDYDGDGDLDFVLAGYDGAVSISRVYQNTGGAFTDIAAGLPGASASSLAWGDYDNDGDLDLLMQGSTGATAVSRVYRNTGGTFTDIGAGLFGVAGGVAAWGDYDNDGDLDILLSGSPDGVAIVSRIYRNTAGIFTDINAGLTGLGNGTGAWVDYDNDGDLDAFLTGTPDGSAAVSRLYRNTAGTFTDTGISFPGARSSTVAWGDYDNDGDADLLIAGQSSSGYIASVYRNEGGGIFTDIAAGLTAVRYTSGAWGDYDNDGDLDILLIGITSGGGVITRIYVNTGGVFAGIAGGIASDYFGCVAWGDYDNDRDLDVLITGITSGGSLISRVYRNNSGVADTAPTAPSGASSSVALNGRAHFEATLNWLAATDAQTPAAGLSYNIRVGTTSGASDLLAPMALASGVRLVPRTGNVGQRLSGTIGILPERDPRTCYWSVQAIDHTFLGSTFLATASFQVPGTDAHWQSIGDVPSDQGRYVRAAWSRSGYDAAGSGVPVTSYTVWRRLSPSDDRTLYNVPAGLEIDVTTFPPGQWEAVGTSPAVQWSTYQMVVPTLCDSTVSGGMCWSVFVISAHTTDPFTYFVSRADSGYSRDNLAPSIPTGLHLAASTLAWDLSVAEDFRYFSVFASTQATFDSTATLLSYTTGTTFDVSAHPAAHYYVTATDFAGNRSQAASLHLATSVAAGASAPVFALHPAWPNPSRDGVSIRYELAAASRVFLRVYDTAGRLVEVLRDGVDAGAGMHTMAWEPKGVAPGMYFVRLTSGESVATERVEILR